MRELAGENEKIIINLTQKAFFFGRQDVDRTEQHPVDHSV